MKIDGFRPVPYLRMTTHHSRKMLKYPKGTEFFAVHLCISSDIRYQAVAFGISFICLRGLKGNE